MTGGVGSPVSRPLHPIGNGAVRRATGEPRTSMLRETVKAAPLRLSNVCSILGERSSGCQEAGQARALRYLEPAPVL